jgi:hypothetical protein
MHNSRCANIMRQREYFRKCLEGTGGSRGVAGGGWAEIRAGIERKGKKLRKSRERRGK